jgi:ribonuclease-3
MKTKGEAVECNERLEFLGDSVLSIIVSRYLFSRYKDIQEGDLTKIRASVVCEKALAKYSQKIGLGNYLLLGKGEDNNKGRERPSIIADAFEAVLGAFYIDTDFNSEPIAEFLMPFVKDEIEYIRSSASFVDYKTTLQQIVQQASGERLEYVLVGEKGPDHSKTFTVEARLNSNVIGIGEGASKRQAEQMAAKKALETFK